MITIFIIFSLIIYYKLLILIKKLKTNFRNNIWNIKRLIIINLFPISFFFCVFNQNPLHFFFKYKLYLYQVIRVYCYIWYSELFSSNFLNFINFYIGFFIFLFWFFNSFFLLYIINMKFIFIFLFYIYFFSCSFNFSFIIIYILFNKN